MQHTPPTDEQLNGIAAVIRNAALVGASIDPGTAELLLAEVYRLRAELAAAEAEKAKLIRWHGEDETELAEAQPEPETGGDLIEDYLKFLRGQGPEPDLSGLPPEQRAAVAGQLQVVRALADRDPELLPIDRDPVALRLGLTAGQPAAGVRQPDTETPTARTAALLEAADLAKAEGDRLYADRWPTAAQAAWTIADKLRQRATKEA